MKRFLLVLSAFALALSASAATPKRKAVAKAPAKKAAVAKPAAPVETAHRKTPYVGAISVDAATGRVLFEEHADAEAYPASVTKLMTLLLVMEDVKQGKYGFVGGLRMERFSRRGLSRPRRIAAKGTQPVMRIAARPTATHRCTKRAASLTFISATECIISLMSSRARRTTPKRY